jgi:DNA (cytosine-5)-methyltransferase 1
LHLKCLDLFCKQGGASRGLADAGFQVTGLDIDPQPLYPFDFIQADATTYPLDGYDFYWASPPCQLFSKLKGLVTKQYPDLLSTIRDQLTATSKPFVIENVPGAPLQNPLLLCGTMFGLKVRRHRLFECHPPIYPLLPPHGCRGPAGFTNVYHGVSAFKNNAKLISVVGHSFNVRDARAAMGIDWMNAAGLSQAVPPAMSHFIASLLIDHLHPWQLTQDRH